eukprot:m.125613 g.125613  ORF g.125613 m.125613 type:complete len:488 (+) comp9431_c0_seq4:59-1522(+)
MGRKKKVIGNSTVSPANHLVNDDVNDAGDVLVLANGVASLDEEEDGVQDDNGDGNMRSQSTHSSPSTSPNMNTKHFNPRTNASLSSQSTLSEDDVMVAKEMAKKKRHMRHVSASEMDGEEESDEKHYDKFTMPDNVDDIEQVENSDHVLPPANDLPEYIEQLIYYINSDEDCELSEEEVVMLSTYLVGAEKPVVADLIPLDVANAIRVAILRTQALPSTLYNCCLGAWKVLQMPESDDLIESKEFLVVALVETIASLPQDSVEGITIATQCIGALSATATSSNKGQTMLSEAKAHEIVCTFAEGYLSATKKNKSTKGKSLRTDEFEKWTAAFFAFFVDGNAVLLHQLAALEPEKLCVRFLQEHHNEVEVYSFSLMALAHLSEDKAAAKRMLKYKVASIALLVVQKAADDSFTVSNAANLLCNLAQTIDHKDPEISKKEAEAICNTFRPLMDLHPEARYKIRHTLSLLSPNTIERWAQWSLSFGGGYV